MSVDTHSSIFNDFIERIKKKSPSYIKHIVSNEPVINADIHHYHRPQKCSIENISRHSLCTLHFDPLDLRQHSSVSDVYTRLNLFEKVVFLNKRSFNTCSFLEEKRVFIPHGYDQRLTLRSQKKPHNKLNVAVICKYYKDGRKGEAYLFELFNMLPSNARLFLIGHNWPKQIEKRCKNIKIIQPASYCDVIKLYSVIDLVLIASPYEGGPACLPEAIAAGCIVFSSRCGMAEDLLDENFFINYDLNLDRGKILSAINNLNDKRKCAVSKLITWDDVSHSYNNLYQSMI
ncbi:glycosyltransferase [Aeromonas veronii]|uniref:glycosyltransferase n=1 Tax=Aeromonas veronii TaxID=654 RepID=UPI001F2997C0|nr:glycosyltransferase [Aeromonas veronii]MCF5866926.1 glycosyltransferase [Aeromonas veronii]